MLKKDEIAAIRERLSAYKKPLFFFDDDADGLCSFLLMYRHVKEGKGFVVKSRPLIDESFLSKIEDHDVVFILDVAQVSQEFVDSATVPVIWIDHHGPYDIGGVKYYNPRKHKASITYPTTNICYDVVQSDLWLAMVGCVGDWYLPSFTSEFRKEYPDLLDKGITDPGDALFESEVGRLVRIFSFILKGGTSDVMKSVRVLTRINSPYEILKQESPNGKFIYSRYKKIAATYDRLLAGAMKKKSDDFLIFTYKDDTMSFTGDLSNELLHKFSDKIIIVAREKSGEMRMSLRSSKVELPGPLEKSLKGLDGYGGGHEHACGACVKVEQFDEFVKRLREQM